MRLAPCVLASFALVAPLVAHAQPENQPLSFPEMLTLDDAVRIFRQRGLELLIADAQVVNAEGDLRVAGAVPNPSWQAFGSYTFEPPANLSGTPTTPWGYSVGLGDSAALEDSLSGKRWLRLKVARAALAAARMSRVDAERVLELQVKTQYIEAVLARDTLDFALQVQTGANQIFELNKTRYKAGAISEADLAKVETNKLQADQDVDRAAEALRAAKVQLAFLLGARAAVPEFHIEQDLPRFAVPAALAQASPQSLIVEAMLHRPDLKAAIFARDRAQAGVALAKRLRFPDLALQVQYQQQGPFSSVAVQPPTLSFGIGGTLPLFYFQRGEIMKASADLRVQQLQRAKAEAAVVADVEAGYNSFVSTRRLVARMEARLLDRSRRARDLVSLQYQKGAASLLEYLDAQRTFIANNEEYLQDLAHYWTAVYQLEAAVGMDLR
jgi:cobalt-zinc-cadmium efflux system outer membrane protein